MSALNVATHRYTRLTLCVWTVSSHTSQKAFGQPWKICWACHLIFPLLHAGHGLYSSISTLYQGSQQQGSILSYDLIVDYYQPSQDRHVNALRCLLAKVRKYQLDACWCTCISPFSHLNYWMAHPCVVIL